MKNVKKVFTIFLLLMIINMVINGTITYAALSAGTDATDASAGVSSGGSWLQAGDLKHEFSDTTDASSAATNMLRTITVIVKVVGVAVAIVMLLTLGMKYMISAPEEKGEIKKHAVVYIIGAVVLFGAVGLLNIIEMFTKSINSVAE